MADTGQQTGTLQTTGNNLQQVRSDLQPTSAQSSQASQNNISQQSLPINNQGLKVQTLQAGSPLPTGITPDTTIPSSSIEPILIALLVATLLIISLAFWSIRPRKIVNAVVAPTEVPQPSTTKPARNTTKKKAATKPKLKSKTRKTKKK